MLIGRIQILMNEESKCLLAIFIQSVAVLKTVFGMQISW